MQPLAALGCHNLSDGDQDLAPFGDTSELVLLSYVTRLPEVVLAEMMRRNPRYQLRHSAAFEEKYYANTCECGAIFGDHHLYSIPSGAFFPEDAVAARAITIEPLDLEGPQPFECLYSIGDTGRCILAYAKRPAAAASSG